MLLAPRKVKYRRKQRGRLKGVATRGATVSFGTIGLKATDRGYLSARQIEAARVAMTRHVKRGGKVWVMVFPDYPVTKKPQEVKMGKGKGGLDHYACPVRPGRVLFEMAGVSEELAREALARAASKLSVTTKIVKA